MRLLARIAPLAFFLILAVVSVSAQEITPANLPADTSFVIFSHSSAQIRAAAPTSPVVQAWYGPESSLFRKLLLQYAVSRMDAKVNGQKFNLTPENTDRLISVLQNSFVLGMSGNVDYTKLAAQMPKDQPGNAFDGAGLFFILDTTGKEAQFGILWPALVAALPKEIVHSQFDFAGTSVEKFKGPNNTTFAARAGNRFVWSTQQRVLEDLIGRLKTGAPSGNSLAENPEFQHCQAHPVPGAVLDGFFKFPDLSKIPIPPNPQFDSGASLQALHLNSLHAMCGTFSMTPDGESGRWLIFGDTSQPNLLSWFGSNHAKFETLALAPPSASSITVATFDLQALYKTLKIALAAGMPGRQQASADLAEGMVSMQLGMPIPDLLGVFRGEFASIKIPSQSSDPIQVYALTISNPDRILNLIHKLAPTAISGETHENSVTYFKTGAQIPTGMTGRGSQAADAQTYVALTPQLLLASADEQALHDIVARSANAQSSPGVGSLDNNPDVRRIRAMFPDELLGFTITDYSREDFQKEMTKTFTEALHQDNTKMDPAQLQLLEGLSRIPWSTFVGKLHWSVGAWWKDADGIHFESRVQ